MSWKNLSLGGKLTLAFGSVSLILAIVAVWSITGIGFIVSDAELVIDGNKFRGNLQEKYTQHIQWVDKLSTLVYDVDVKSVELQTDPHKCAFGEWYYGNGLKEVESIAPELLPVFKEMEQPHILLHGSAVSILDVYHSADYNLSILIQSIRGDHLAWGSAVKDAIMNNARQLNVQMDPHECNLGKWISNTETQQIISTDSKLKAHVNGLISDHNKLHESAKTIDNYLRRGNITEAKSYFNANTKGHLEANLINLNNLIAYNNANLEGIREAEDILHKETQPNLQKLGVLFNKAIEDSKNYILTDEHMLTGAKSTQMVVLLLGIIAIIVAIVLTIGITKVMVAPIKKAVGFAQEMADGNLMANISCSTNDEMGQLCDALSDMSGKLRGIVKEIIEGADNITAASMEMSSTSQTVSQGASEQASATEEVSASMEQMTANIQQNADNSKQTESIATKAVVSIKEGTESTNIAVNSMKEIADKIKIINDIAFQTNILALNAAVEAARAGEHGKGFAVVAAEVRKLAERSKIAADEINVLSNSGVKISEKAGIQLAILVPEIEKTSDLIREINASSNEQNSGAEQINNAIQQLSQVTQQNAAASEQLASSSEELASQAEQLKELIGYFKVDDGGYRRKNLV
jgi:methyl-accepting chemotaxis protein